MPLLAVSAHDIDTAGLPLEAELPPAWLAHELSDANLTLRPSAPPARVEARLSRSGEDIVVRGRVRAALTTPCARCLDPALVDVDTTLSLLLQPAAVKPSRKDEEYEFSANEADVDTYDGETVVLDPFVREAILLEVPNFPLCSEGCPGIRPAAAHAPDAAAEPPLDPRLAPLGALRARLTKTKKE